MGDFIMKTLLENYLEELTKLGKLGIAASGIVGGAIGHAIAMARWRADPAYECDQESLKNRAIAFQNCHNALKSKSGQMTLKERNLTEVVCYIPHLMKINDATVRCMESAYANNPKYAKKLAKLQLRAKKIREKNIQILKMKKQELRNIKNKKR